jgi:hypothetical protein
MRWFGNRQGIKQLAAVPQKPLLGPSPDPGHNPLCQALPQRRWGLIDCPRPTISID